MANCIMRNTKRREIILEAHHFIENWRIIVLVLDRHFDSAHVVKVWFSVVSGPHRQVNFFFSSRLIPIEHLRN